MVIVFMLIVKPYNGSESGLNIEISTDLINGVIVACDVIFTIQVISGIMSFG